MVITKLLLCYTNLPIDIAKLIDHYYAPLLIRIVDNTITLFDHYQKKWCINDTNRFQELPSFVRWMPRDQIIESRNIYLAYNGCISNSQYKPLHQVISYDLINDTV